MVTTALLVCLTYCIIQWVDRAFSWQTMSRPIVAAPLCGLLLGQFQAGVVLGGSLEAVFMGISAIGGSVAADALTSSLIAVAFASSYTNIEEGIVAATTIAMPIGTLMSQFNSLTSPIWASTAPYFEELAASGNIKSFKLQVLVFGMLIVNVVPVTVLFLSVAFGTDKLQAAWESLPATIKNGLGAASGMMTGVGYAILLSMLWTGEVGCFFFVGFVLAKYLGLGSLPIALLGAAIAITMFFTDKKFVDLKNSGVAAGNSEEDFF